MSRSREIISRRDFLNRASFAACLPFISPFLNFGRSGRRFEALGSSLEETKLEIKQFEKPLGEYLRGDFINIAYSNRLAGSPLVDFCSSQSFTPGRSEDENGDVMIFSRVVAYDREDESGSYFFVEANPRYADGRKSDVFMYIPIQSENQLAGVHVEKYKVEEVFDGDGKKLLARGEFMYEKRFGDKMDSFKNELCGKVKLFPGNVVVEGGSEIVLKDVVVKQDPCVLMVKHVRHE